ncbi:protein mono-ADP-ribosyltransferase PARP12-like [Sardina pilchardus]|uniref:protein mono-ADP-ribosyltransferase PARP12-like n=1 Tax=Sardina pilchardus TaxID=27697 RepID=UPI002E11A10D
MASRADDESSASDLDDESSGQCSSTDSDSQSGVESDSEHGASRGQSPSGPEPCKYYNSRGGCRNGSRCSDQHVCKDSWSGFCRNGHSCRLKHIGASDSEEDSGAGRRGGSGGSGGRRNPGGRTRGNERRPRRRSPSSESDLEDGEPYRWQLDCGRGWKDIANDHILEAQYSRPCTKGINIYNTPYGVISIDFKHMRVRKKSNVRVRRRGSQQTKWLWYYKGKKRWHQYGEKDSKGKQSPVKSSVLEKEYQKHKKGSHQFTVGSDTFEIRFKDMCQVNLSSGQKRKISRRPLYDSSQSRGSAAVTQGMRRTDLSSSPRGRWQFKGQGKNWHDFKNRVECSVTSADIEAQYQRNPQGQMTFTVSGQTFKLDFSAMTQTNMSTNKSRRIQRK